MAAKRATSRASVKAKSVKAKPVKVVNAEVIRTKKTKPALKTKAAGKPGPANAKSTNATSVTAKRDDALLEGFCSELSIAIDEVMPWFRRLGDNPKYNGTLDLRFMHMWPSGIAAHPRVIEVIRRYLVSAETLIEAREVAETKSAKSEEDDDQYSTPYQMLFARVRRTRPKLFEHLARFFFMPVGFDDHVAASGGGNAASKGALRTKTFAMKARAEDTEIVRHDVQRGRLRLYMNPKDFRDADNSFSALPAVMACSAAHAAAHTAWLSDASFAVDQALKWWRSVVGRGHESGMPLADAAKAAYERWPAGPSSSEHVVSVVRRHWLACEKRNTALGSADKVFPEDFLLGTLDPATHSRIILVLTAMPYWPMGLDGAGQWC